MSDNRILANGNRLNFTCENKRFKTDIDLGYEHHAGDGYKGSVTDEPLYEDGGSLWIEHVLDKSNGNKCFWFMWYDQNGQTILPMSSVFDKDDLQEMIKKIAQIKIAI